VKRAKGLMANHNEHRRDMTSRSPIPLSPHLIAAPRVKFVRGISMVGDSFVYNVIRAVKEKLEAVKHSLPEDVSIVTTYDRYHVLGRYRDHDWCYPNDDTEEHPDGEITLEGAERGLGHGGSDSFIGGAYGDVSLLRHLKAQLYYSIILEIWKQKLLSTLLVRLLKRLDSLSFACSCRQVPRVGPQV
jgi:hypothetical protein